MATTGHASASVDPELARELRKEAYTMALYVAIVLLAASMAITDVGDHGHGRTLGLVWGTTIGLALAHFVAFRLSARLVGGGRIDRHDAAIALAQVVGAAAVAVLCTVPVLLFDESMELDAVRVVLAAFIAVVAYATATSGGSSRGRALVFAGVVLVIAVLVALAKNALGGH